MSSVADLYLNSSSSGAAAAAANSSGLLALRTSLLSSVVVAHDSCQEGYGGDACSSCLSGTKDPNVKRVLMLCASYHVGLPSSCRSGLGGCLVP